MYRRNVDESLSNLHQLFLTTGDLQIRDQLIRSSHRTNQHPYWFQIREHLPRRDQVYYQPETWAERSLTQDKWWKIYLHVPLENGAEFIAWLGEIVCQEYMGFLRGTVNSFRNLLEFDNWVGEGPPISDRKKEIAQANRSLSKCLRGYGIAFQYKGIINIEGIPLNWNPTQLVLRTNVIELNHPDNPDLLPSNRLYFHDSNIQDPREDDPLIILPNSDFNLIDYLFAQFTSWLKVSDLKYAQKLRTQIFPLGPQFPTIMEGRWISLHYWKIHEEVQEAGWTNITYQVKWHDDYQARFWRWGHNIGSDQWGSEKIYAKKDLQEKIEGMIAIAQKYGYRVLVKEGKPESPILIPDPILPEK